jgi:hypothetical protein
VSLEFGIIVKKTVNSVLKIIDDIFKFLRGEEIKGFFNIHGSILAALKQLANTRSSKEVNHMTLEAYPNTVEKMYSGR